MKNKGKIACESSESEEREKTDCDSDSDSGYYGGSDYSEANEVEIERSSVTASISVAVSGVDIEKDEWIANWYQRGWCSGQFVQFDSEEEEILVHFLHQSSLNSN